MTDSTHTGSAHRYAGPSGRTRTERVRVFREGCDPTEAEVFRVVNVEEDPELREPALIGALHRLDDGDAVEVPFVYHDPAARHFVLVVPSRARQRELSERLRLLDSLMREPDKDVPDYVRHFAIVYGAQGLRAHLADAETMEVDDTELEPVDGFPVVASCFPRLAALVPASAYWAHASTELAPLVDDEELWLFARADEEVTEAFSEASSDLLIQLKTLDGLAVCVLALTDSRSGAVRRGYLDPTRSMDQRVLELLCRDFHATVVVSDGQQRLVRSFRLEAPRAANAKMILARAASCPRASAERWAQAIEACRVVPPPVEHGEHPFVLDEEAPSAAVALRRLQHLEAWNSPERIEEALLVRSVPRTVVELSRRRIVADACRFGLPLGQTLLKQAVRFGLASDVAQLVHSLVRRFEEIVPVASEQGFDATVVEASQAALARLLAAHGTSTPLEVSCNMEHSG